MTDTYTPDEQAAIQLAREARDHLRYSKINSDNGLHADAGFEALKAMLKISNGFWFLDRGGR